MPARRVLPTPESLAQIAAVAELQGGVFRLADALRAGVTRSQVNTLVRRGEWVSLGRGVLAEAGSRGQQRHLLLCADRMRCLGADAYVSHASAGAVHGLPYVRAPRRPSLTVPRLGKPEHLTGLLSSRVPPHHLTTLEGLPITTKERTLVDLMRCAPDRFEAQALADGGARAGVSNDEVARVLADCSGWPGVLQARTAWELADARAESPLESLHRLLMQDAGLPRPVLQVRLCDARGRQVARVDFFFEEERTVVESDGRVKYDDPWGSSDGTSPLWEEKAREDRVRDLGLEVVRATWRDRHDAGVALAARVRRAFARAAARRAA